MAPKWEWFTAFAKKRISTFYHQLKRKATKQYGEIKNPKVQNVLEWPVINLFSHWLLAASKKEKLEEKWYVDCSTKYTIGTLDALKSIYNM